jgi:hypothetical protein
VSQATAALVIVAGLILRRGQVADRLRQSAMVKPIDSVERGEFDGLEMSPRPFPTNHLGLEEADDRFGHRIIIGITATADGGREPGISQAVGVAHRHVLRAAVAVMDEAVEAFSAAVIACMFQRVEDEVGGQGRGAAPADHPPREDVDHKGDVHESTPRRDNVKSETQN